MKGRSELEPGHLAPLPAKLEVKREEGDFCVVFGPRVLLLKRPFHRVQVVPILMPLGQDKRHVALL